MVFTRTARDGTWALWLLAASAVNAFAQAPLERAKALYLEASYDEALAALSGPESDQSADAQLYRALCWIALGRGADAELALARSIAIDPLGTSARPDMSPRVVQLVTDARRRLLPDAARRAVTSGRAALQVGERATAEKHFDQAARILADPALADLPDLRDLRVVAEGFLDLVRAQAAATSLAPLLPPTAPPAPPAPQSDLAPSSAVAAAAPVRPAPSSNQPETSPPPRNAPVITPARPIEQSLPSWRSSDASLRRVELRGAVRLTVDATGRVSAAAIEQSVAPGYDRLLLDAVRRWRYEPARRNGVPTEAEFVVPVVLPARLP